MPGGPAPHAFRGLALLALAVTLSSCRKTHRHEHASSRPSSSAVRHRAPRHPAPATAAASIGSTAPAGSASAAAHAEPAPVHVDMPEAPLPPAARPDASGPEANRAIFSDYGFPGYPALTHLCGRRVYEQGGEHLTWDAFASSSTPTQLVTYYKRWLGSRGFEAQRTGGVWHIPEAAPTRTLSIDAAHSKGPWQSCPKPPPAGTRCVIVISRR